MFNELQKKEVETVKAMMDAYKASIDYAQSELEVIDEKYKKLIAEEKKSLKEQLATSKTQLKVWEKMFNNFDSTLVESVLGKFESTSTEPEEEEKVVDNLFPENNEPEDIAEPAPVAEDAGEPAGVPDADIPSSDAVDADKPAEPSEEEKKELEDEAIAEDLNDAIREEKAEAETHDLDAEEDAEWTNRIESGELTEVEFPAEEKKTPVLTTTEDGWMMLDEWK